MRDAVGQPHGGGEGCYQRTHGISSNALVPSVRLQAADGTRVTTSQGRPLWKRAATFVRRRFYRLASAIESVAGRDELLPPGDLRVHYYGTWSRERFTRACADVKGELMSRGLQPQHRVLDVGSGIGNLALALTGYLQGGYDGIEIHPEAVAWCQQHISRAHPTFRFHRADLVSHAYNPEGISPAASYRFPFPDRQFDFIFLGSVFTHMMPDAVEQYLREISRLLAPGGMCVATYFLLNDETRPGVDAFRSFMSFGVQHPSGVCRLHESAVPESAVAFEEAFVRQAHERAGLLIQDIRRGRWWSGIDHDQDVVTASRR